MSSPSWSVKVECDNCMNKYGCQKKVCPNCGAENYELKDNLIAKTTNNFFKDKNNEKIL